MKFSRTLLASVAVLATMGAAQAADLIVNEASAVAVSSAHDWSGLYAGVAGGYSVGTVDWTGQFFAGEIGGGEFGGDVDLSGWALGLQAGANAQFDMFVLGIEGDISWANISGEGAPLGGGIDATVPSSTLNWIGTLRGRAGVAVDQVLLYGTAGFAIAGGEMGLTNLDALNDNRTADISAKGWTAGVGAEIALDDNLSIKGEYLYTSLTMDEVQFDDVLPAEYLAVNSTTGIHSFKVGLNYAF